MEEIEKGGKRGKGKREEGGKGDSIIVAGRTRKPINDR